MNVGSYMPQAMVAEFSKIKIGIAINLTVARKNKNILPRNCRVDETQVYLLGKGRM